MYDTDIIYPLYKKNNNLKRYVIKYTFKEVINESLLLISKPNQKSELIILRTHAYIPSDEKYLALLAIVDGDKIKIKYSITTIVDGEGGGEIIVAFTGAADLIDHDCP